MVMMLVGQKCTPTAVDTMRSCREWRTSVCAGAGGIAVCMFLLAGGRPSEERCIPVYLNSPLAKARFGVEGGTRTRLDAHDSDPPPADMRRRAGRGREASAKSTLPRALLPRTARVRPSPLDKAPAWRFGALAWMGGSRYPSCRRDVTFRRAMEGDGRESREGRGKKKGERERRRPVFRATGGVCGGRHDSSEK